MSKAIFVMDMPEGCAGCRVTKCEFDNMDKNSSANKCPLLPMPQKKKLSCDNWEYNIQVKAWNACIDAIGGDAK